ncbi:hypothetical protein, partial [Kosakonia cowanii]|uniref:hypothetical protein n=1 Tax=Kosakonia cowanii TaxID=208223 RepID=UPI0028977272
LVIPASVRRFQRGHNPSLSYCRQKQNRYRWNCGFVGRISVRAIRHYLCGTDCRMAATPYPAYAVSADVVL